MTASTCRRALVSHGLEEVTGKQGPGHKGRLHPTVAIRRCNSATCARYSFWYRSHNPKLTLARSQAWGYASGHDRVVGNIIGIWQAGPR
jgi:hypothetical protein